MPPLDYFLYKDRYHHVDHEASSPLVPDLPSKDNFLADDKLLALYARNYFLFQNLIYNI